MPASKLDVFFDNSPVFRLKPDAAVKGVKAVAWFDTRDAAAQRLGVGPELSRGRRGDARGRTIGKGKVYMFGPEITFRGQPHGTFKFLFNGIYAPTNVTPSVVP